ncbi:DNA invertase Pin-like site-specific DNA recombinase [Erythromicrobium ramosum]|uniref:DNA invertase Pin-like site-specific DNA recombinase n=1 Tax=Erythrobacter ramosus TaxID=35811 RepID=A0A6I4UKC9_9SPHN|nr:recombinase family protein [Erythrobacter ramosus]MBB3774062.1 DNA invertase Pin-like site-specific DNA recombinase [Erythrobacter ramosus]MXP38274.1 helix-turn-helix domain-containing protein [Erythrobacter ramosus]
MTTIIGYARASTEDQDCSIQEEALSAAGCTVVRSEKKSGTTRQGREQLDTILDFLHHGDTLVVTRIDRLARSVKDLEDIVETIRAKGAHLQATEQPIDTTTPAGIAFLQMLGVFAQFETALRKERQMEGIAKAKAAGAYKGRKPSVPIDEVRRLKSEGLNPTQISKELKIGRASVYRVLGA